MKALWQMQIQSVLVEGGSTLLKSFIEEQLWDEARIISSDAIQIPDGVSAPALGKARFILEERLQSDTIRYYRKDVF